MPIDGERSRCSVGKLQGPLSGKAELAPTAGQEIQVAMQPSRCRSPWYASGTAEWLELIPFVTKPVLLRVFRRSVGSDSARPWRLTRFALVRAFYGHFAITEKGRFSFAKPPLADFCMFVIDTKMALHFSPREMQTAI